MFLTIKSLIIITFQFTVLTVFYMYFTKGLLFYLFFLLFSYEFVIMFWIVGFKRSFLITNLIILLFIVFYTITIKNIIILSNWPTIIQTFNQGVIIMFIFLEFILFLFF